MGKTSAVRGGRSHWCGGERWTGGRKKVSPLGVPIIFIIVLDESYLSFHADFLNYLVGSVQLN